MKRMAQNPEQQNLIAIMQNTRYTVVVRDTEGLTYTTESC
jgi:hypothetical protein